MSTLVWLTERRESRTHLPWGYHGVPVLKNCLVVFVTLRGYRG